MPSRKSGFTAAYTARINSSHAPRVVEEDISNAQAAVILYAHPGWRKSYTEYRTQKQQHILCGEQSFWENMRLLRRPTTRCWEVQGESIQGPSQLGRS